MVKEPRCAASHPHQPCSEQSDIGQHKNESVRIPSAAALLQNQN
jgi:hypothetical protein